MPASILHTTRTFPFGETMIEQGGFDYDNPYKFNGKELDPQTGYYYYGARYYDPVISRWLSVDPLAEKYPAFSPYNYTANNPVMLVDPDGREPDDWFVNKKTGALVYIEGEHQLNEETVKKAFGEQQADLIFNNEKNDYSNWERLGDDTMFDTEENKISKNQTMYIPESVAEDFANKRGFKKAIKQIIHIETFVAIDWEGNAGDRKETPSDREYVLDEGITYAKKNSIKYLPGSKITRIPYGRVEDTYEERIIINGKFKNKNNSFWIKLGTSVIEYLWN